MVNQSTFQLRLKNNVLAPENFFYCKLRGPSVIKLLDTRIPDTHHCFDKYAFPLQWKSYRELLPSRIFRKCTTACKRGKWSQYQDSRSGKRNEKQLICAFGRTLVTDPYKKHTIANNFHKQVTLFHQYVKAKCHTDADTTEITLKMPVSFLFQLIQLRNNGQKPTDKCIKTVCSVMYKNRVQ